MYIRIGRNPVGFVQLLRCVQLFETPWTAAHHASLSFTLSRRLLRVLISIELVMLSSHLILRCSLGILGVSYSHFTVFPGGSEGLPW